MLIGGELVAGEGPALSVENPATEEELASVALPSDAQVDAAIAAASEAFRPWAAMPAGERAELLHEVAIRLRAQADELGELMSREGGKPLIENTDEVGWTAAAFDYYAEMGRNFAGRVIPPIESSQLALVLKEPIGVVAAIVPWNYPLLLLAWKLAPALAAGQHRRVQAERADAAFHAGAAFGAFRSACGRGVAAARREGGRGAGGRRSAGRLRGVHRVDRDGQGDRPRVRRPRGPREPGDGRQGPVPRAARRGLGGGRRRQGRSVGGVPQRGAGVHVGRAVLRARGGLRRLRRAR